MILIFNGPPGSGKDLCCDFLKQHKSFQHIEFKKQLYKETIKYFAVDEKWFFDGYTRENKETPEIKLNGLSRRDAMIFVSEKYIKPIYGQGYFGKKACEDIIIENDYCVSDGGFVEEIHEIINKFGSDKIVLIRLFRDGVDFRKDSRKYIKSSNVIKSYTCGKETDNIELYNDQFFEYTFDLKCFIIHNNGTLNELNNSIEEIIKEIQ